MGFNIPSMPSLPGLGSVTKPKSPAEQQPKIFTEDSIYPLAKDNWLQRFPYAFKAKIDGEDKIFYLPINPQNISITTHFGTNVISTLYGTVEEHSEQRYFDISIQGTTGFAPAFAYAYDVNEKFNTKIRENGKEWNKYSTGRQNFALGILSDIDKWGFGAGPLAKANQVVNKANDLKNTWKNSGPFESGVTLSGSGYVAFHNFYRFLLLYKKSAASGSDVELSPDEQISEQASNSPLYFVNFKDNNQYSAAIQTFTLVRSVENPMLYNYNIQVRAYNLTALTSTISSDQKAFLQSLGLQESEESIGSKLKKSVNSAKDILNTVKNIPGL
jgi:hypothetical protein